MKLSVLDRLSLLSLLPKEGDFTTLRIVRELRERLSFTEEEHRELDFRQTATGETEWKAAADPEREFEFSPLEVSIITEALKKADKAKKLTLDHMSVYEKFMETA